MNSNDRIIAELLSRGMSLDGLHRLDGEWPVVVFRNAIRNGRLTRSLEGWFDIFLPVRPVTLTEVTGETKRRQFHYRRGMVGFCPPAERWTIEWLGLLEGLVIVFAPETLERAARDIYGHPDGALIWRRALSDHAPSIAHLGLDLASQISSGTGHPVLLTLECKTLCALLARRYSRTPARDTSRDGMISPHVLTALNHIELHLSDALSVTDIADVAGISPGHVNRLFRAETGQSVWAYVKRRRMERAEALLEDPSLTVAQVARRIGYRSRTSFTAHFQRHAGHPPRAAANAPDAF